MHGNTVKTSSISTAFLDRSGGAVVRNHCVHHARVIDRKIAHTPRFARTLRGHAWYEKWPDSRRVYATLANVAVILETIPGGDDRKRQAVQLLKNPTGVSLDEIGVPEAWEDEPVWKRP
jgi:abortive infection bacteriophage resistance protein